jgi:hypothetical protein
MRFEGQAVGMTVQPEIPTERTALVVAALWERQQLSTREAAELCGISRQGAFDLMCRISRVLPVVQIEGHWQRFEG